MCAIESTENFYNETYHHSPAYGKADSLRVSTILGLIGKKQKVLDIGCWDGSISQLIRDNQNEVYGVDVSKKAVEHANAKGIKAYAVAADSPYPFPDNFFSVVFAGEVIEHVMDTDKFLSELRRILIPHGQLVITTPNVASLGRRISLLIGNNPYLETTMRPGDAGHIRYFTKGSLKELLVWHHFSVIEFTSDAINLCAGGGCSLAWLGRIWPTLGRSLIVLARKES